MKKGNVLFLLSLSFAFMLSGCVVRTYPLTRDRVDQDLSMGNRGFVQGTKELPEVERKTTRTTRVVEIEMRSPLRFEGSGKKKAAMKIEKAEEQGSWGNRGYTSQSESLEISEPSSSMAGMSYEQYTVQKGDTLQKISKKFFGTTKKWSKIFDANTDTLKAPNKIYPGQVINIPVEGLKEPKENLK